MASLTCVCGAEAPVGDARPGERVKCPVCASLLTVPGATAVPASPAPAPPSPLPPQHLRGRMPEWAFLLVALALASLALPILFWISCYGIVYHEPSKAEVARKKALMLEFAARAYYSVHNHWPNQLSDLAQRDERHNNLAWCETDDLLDPWGQPYRMALPGRHNKTGNPDIYTVNPDNGQQIGNW
jgi:hypothetical protein